MSNTVVSLQRSEGVLIIKSIPEAMIAYLDGKEIKERYYTYAFCADNHCSYASDDEWRAGHRVGLCSRTNQVVRADADKMDTFVMALKIGRKMWEDAGFPGIENKDGIEIETL